MVNSDRPMSFTRIRNKSQRPYSADYGNATAPACDVQSVAVNCSQRQVMTLSRMNPVAEDKESGPSKTYPQGTLLNAACNTASILTKDLDLEVKTYKRIAAAERQDRVQGHHRPDGNHIKQPVINNQNLSTSSNDCYLIDFQTDVSTLNITDQTAAFLSYEIDPCLVEEYRRTRSSRRKRIENKSVFNVSGTLSRKDVRHFLLWLISESDIEDYCLFCDLLREESNDHYLANFLEALHALLRLQKSTSHSSEDMKSKANSSPSTSSGSSLSDWSQCSCFASEKPASKDQRFSLDLVYVDRESRSARSFKGVASMKCRKYRKTQTEKDPRTKVHVSDTSDRYVPMISLQVYNQFLCECRMRRLQSLVETHSCIRDLSIVKIPLEASAKVRLSRTLEQNVGLYQLDLSLSDLGNDGVMYLSNALRYNRSLKVLNLSSNRLNARGCSMLVKGMLGNRTLIDLDLSFNEIEDQGCMSLSEALINSKCILQKLRLRNNRITSRGASALFVSLRHNSRLCVIDLSSNDIGDDSLKVLSDSLIYNRTLTDLVVDSCCISLAGCLALARPLKINTVIRCLSVNMNPIADAGLKAIVDGIKYNRGVVELSLNMCGITNTGLWHLLDATRYNTTLRTLKLCYNFIDVGPSPTNGVHNTRKGERRSSALFDLEVTPRSQSKVAASHGSLSIGQSRLSAFFRDDIAATDDVCRSEVYSKLVEVLHKNFPLKIVLWGNRLNEVVQVHSIVSENSTENRPTGNNCEKFQSNNYRSYQKLTSLVP